VPDTGARGPGWRPGRRRIGSPPPEPGLHHPAGDGEQVAADLVQVGGIAYAGPLLVLDGWSTVRRRTRPGARGALLFYSCVPVSEFGPAWPDGVPVQVHGMDADPIFVDEGDIDTARELIGQAEDGELFLYPGDQHYFADSSLPSYDRDATALLIERVLDFLRTR
jgi:dienelactone hydrolase